MKPRAPAPSPAAARRVRTKAPAGKTAAARKAAPGTKAKGPKAETAPGKPATKPAAAKPAKAAPPRKPAGTPRRSDRRLAGIRAAAAELSNAINDIETARSGLQEAFARAAAGNLSRAQGALGALRRLAESGPLLDVRRLERDLAVMVEDAGGLHQREGKGRKRDLLAVDEFLGDAAARLELAATSAAGPHLKLLSERLSGLEALRRSHQAAITGRFRARLDRTRRVLAAVPDQCVRLDGRALVNLSRELQSSLGLCKAFPVSRLSGKPGDLYGIDGLVKRLDRRMAHVRSLLGRRKEPSGG